MGSRSSKGKGKTLLYIIAGDLNKKDCKKWSLWLSMSTWHWLDISGFPPCLLSLGALQRCGEGEEEKRGRTEGPTLMSHFANSLQPTLPSQCYTYSTSPKALNSLLFLNRTNGEKHTALSTLCVFDWTFIILVALTWSPDWASQCDHSVIANYLQREKYKHMSAGPAADN